MVHLLRLRSPGIQTPSQEGLAGSTRAIEENAISYEAVAFVFPRLQMALHQLVDLLLRVVHTAEVRKTLGRHIANYLLPLYLRARCWFAHDNGSCSWLLLGSRQENPEKRNHPAY